MNREVSAVMFARDHRVIAAFYRELTGAVVVSSDDHHTTLQFSGFELMVQQIPPHLMPKVAAGAPILRREESAVRLDFLIADLPSARRAAVRLGGSIDEQPPPWAGGDIGFFLGQDPEGNVFGVKPRTAAHPSRGGPVSGRYCHT